MYVYVELNETLGMCTRDGDEQNLMLNIPPSIGYNVAISHWELI